MSSTPQTLEPGSNLSILNRAVYYWDFYSTTQSLDYLIAAAAFLKAYRDNGGNATVDGASSVAACIDGAVKASVDRTQFVNPARP